MLLGVRSHFFLQRKQWNPLPKKKRKSATAAAAPPSSSSFYLYVILQRDFAVWLRCVFITAFDTRRFLTRKSSVMETKQKGKKQGGKNPVRAKALGKPLHQHRF
jgi:hypothetical protein